ncbi:calmodulin-like isoform X2 [Haliotis rufescens]|uniref:calmodulin-like isoform X2 n=1 Tax=Haliotis rufescens TaxID=6454 RepID=UPI001EAF9B9B|nr:calmodulin-like isoform X2 [Haliotis rufescens]
MTNEAVSVPDVFKMFDSDGDGYIPANEIGTPIRALGHVITNTELTALMRSVQVEKRGKVDLKTFQRMADSIQPSDTNRQLKEAFEVIDREGSGNVNATELRHLLTTLGDRMTDDEFNVLLQELDIDKTGNITCSDFIYLMTR